MHLIRESLQPDHQLSINIIIFLKVIELYNLIWHAGTVYFTTMNYMYNAN